MGLGGNILSKKIFALIAVMFLLLLWTGPVLANMMVQMPELDIYVQDYKSEDFTLTIIPLDNTKEGAFPFYDSEKGTLDSEKNMILHAFTTYTPDKFKVELNYPNGESIMSNVIEQGHHGADFILNADTGKIHEIKGMGQIYFYIGNDFMKLVFVCLIATLIIELILALLFKIRPLYLIILTNLLTQAFIHTLSFVMMTMVITQMFDLVIYIAEALIVLIEYLIYSKFAKYKDQTILLVYCLFANGVSFFLGFVFQDEIYSTVDIFKQLIELIIK